MTTRVDLETTRLTYKIGRDNAGKRRSLTGIAVLRTAKCLSRRYRKPEQGIAQKVTRAYHCQWDLQSLSLDQRLRETRYAGSRLTQNWIKTANGKNGQWFRRQGKDRGNLQEHCFGKMITSLHDQSLQMTAERHCQ